jgi:hypothetical protein
MGMRVFTGNPDYYNAYARGILTFAGAANSLYPASRLYDWDPSKEARFNAASLDDMITLDGSIITNAARTVDEGKLNGWTGAGPDGWTKSVSGTGAVSQESTVVRSGSSARIEPGSSGTAAFYRDFTVRSGQPMSVEAWLRGGAGSGVARAEVQIRETGHYLTSAGAWQVAQADWATESGTGAFAQKTRTFTVEGYSTTRHDTVTLRVRFYVTVVSGTAYVEDVALWPAIDTLVICGHNIDAVITVQLRSDTDGTFSANEVLEATLTQHVPSFYVVLVAPVYRRYWRIRFAGTNTSAYRFGEAILGASTAPLEMFEAPILWRPSWDRRWTKTDSGKRFGYKRSKLKRRYPTFSFHYVSQALYDDAMAIWDRAEGGTYPVVVIPDTNRPEVIHGFIPDELPHAQEQPEQGSMKAYYRDLEIPIDESPFAPEE